MTKSDCNKICKDIDSMTAKEYGDFFSSVPSFEFEVVENNNSEEKIISTICLIFENGEQIHIQTKNIQNIFLGQAHENYRINKNKDGLFIFDTDTIVENVCIQLKDISTIDFSELFDNDKNRLLVPDLTQIELNYIEKEISNSKVFFIQWAKGNSQYNSFERANFNKDRDTLKIVIDKEEY